MVNETKSRAGWGIRALVLLSGTALTVALLTSPTLADSRHRDSGSRKPRVAKQVKKENFRYDRKRNDGRRDRIERRHRGYRREELPRSHRQEKFYRHDRRHSRPVFVVPRHIRSSRLGFYRPFYQGRIYDRGHHHHHSVYYFPVYTEFGYAYAPHYYCGSGLAFRGDFVDDDIRGRFSISIGF